MTFVNEIIPDDQKKRFRFPVKTLPDGRQPTLWKWTVDHERNLALVLTDQEGGTYEDTKQIQYYSFLIEGHVINIRCESDIKVNVRDEREITWKISNLSVPKSFIGSLTEVEALIGEAFEVMGHLYSHLRVASVRVDFCGPTFY